MTRRPPPFHSWPGGRLRQVEWTSTIDAPELAWSGVLDGVFDFASWPWAGLAERELDLCRRGCSLDAVRPVRGLLCVESATSIAVEFVFETVASVYPQHLGHRWREVFWLESTPCPFGGRRWWFRCWLCDRRCARLYRAHSLWECRTCQRLTYRSRQDRSWGHRHGGSRARFTHLLDMDERRYHHLNRQALRRRLSRWRKSVRGRSDCRSAWPVQTTCSPELSSEGDGTS